MIVLDSTRSLYAKMSGAAATTNPTFVSSAFDTRVVTNKALQNTAQATPIDDAVSLVGSLSGTTYVQIVAAPASTLKRKIASAYIYNADTAAVTITLALDVNGTKTIFAVKTIQPGETLQICECEISVVGTATLDTIRPINNLLINGGFDMTQRSGVATITVADNGFGPDRWRSIRENAALDYARINGVAESLISNYWYGRYTKTTNAGKIWISQTVEGANSLPMRGRIVRFQCKMKSDTSRTIRMGIMEHNGTIDVPASPLITSIAGGTGTDPTLGGNLTMLNVESKSVTNAWQEFYVTATMSATAENLIVCLFSDADIAVNGELNIAEAGLYHGSEQRFWLPRHIAEEFALCQRYCQVIESVNAENQALCIAHALSTSAARGIMALPVVMRTIPALTATAGDWELTDGVTSLAVTTLAIVSASSTPGILGIQADDSGAGLTQYRGYRLRADAAAIRFFILDAEV